MRDAFVAELYDQRAVDSNIICLAGDIGYRVFDKFRSDFPGAFLNTGIAEQNMIGMAAGLSSNGFIPVVYTIIPFLTMRAFEQIRVDLCMHNRKVLLVGVGGGFSYGNLGPTHHALEDVALMSSLPNMEVIVPRDPLRTREAVQKTIHKVAGPSYIRLAKNGEPNIAPETPGCSMSSLGVEKIKEGTSGYFLTRGPVCSIAVDAIEGLRQHGLHYGLIDVPRCTWSLENILDKTGPVQKLITLEEVYEGSGLQSELAIQLQKHFMTIKTVNFNIKKEFRFEVENRVSLLKQNGISAEQIIQRLTTGK